MKEGIELTYKDLVDAFQIWKNANPEYREDEWRHYCWVRDTLGYIPHKKAGRIIYKDQEVEAE